MPEGAKPESAAMLRLLGQADLQAYKSLRDQMLGAYPQAFTSDAESERAKPAGSYAPRFGLGIAGSGDFTLGAWQDERLVGAISCQHDARRKVRHIGQLIGMMVRPEAQGLGIGRSLLGECVRRARSLQGLELLTLSVTAGNQPALRLYAAAGFEAYGCLRRAIKLGDTYYDKHQLLLVL